MPYLVHRLHSCYFTEGEIEGRQDLVGCALGYQLKEGFSVGVILRPTTSGVEDNM